MVRYDRITAYVHGDVVVFAAVAGLETGRQGATFNC